MATPFRIAFPLALGLFALLTQPAPAQPTNTKRPPEAPTPAVPAAPPPAAPGPAALPELRHEALTTPDFADTPVQIESVGLLARVPVDATVQTTQAGPLTSIQITGPDNAYLITINTRRLAGPDDTPAKWLDRKLKDEMSANAVRDLKTGDIVAVKGKVLSRTPNFSVPGSADPGERAYIVVPKQGEAKDGTGVFRGFTVFRPTSDSFCVFELLCPEARADSAQRAYELTVATAVFTNPATLAASRRDAVLTGIAFLSGLTREHYDKAAAAAGSDVRWFRISRPSPSGAPADAEEVGYRTLRITPATRAQLDGRDDPGRPGPTNPSGYLVEIGARHLERAPGSPGTGGKALTIIDTQGTYFLAADRSSEAWAVKTAVREEGQKPALYTETGTRDARAMTVIVNAPGKPARTLRPTVPAEGYLNQAEIYMLPRLIAALNARAADAAPSASTIEGDLGFYAYSSSSGAVVLRRDRVSRDPALRGSWTLTTRQSENAEPLVTTLSDAGETLSAAWPEGRIIEPMPADEILKLWKSKGLPTGSLATSSPGSPSGR